VQCGGSGTWQRYGGQNAFSVHAYFTSRAKCIFKWTHQELVSANSSKERVQQPSKCRAVIARKDEDERLPSEQCEPLTQQEEKGSKGERAEKSASLQLHTVSTGAAFLTKI